MAHFGEKRLGDQRLPMMQAVLSLFWRNVLDAPPAEQYQIMRPDLELAQLCEWLVMLAFEFAAKHKSAAYIAGQLAQLKLRIAIAEMEAGKWQ